MVKMLRIRWSETPAECVKELRQYEPPYQYSFFENIFSSAQAESPLAILTTYAIGGALSTVYLLL